MLLFSVRIQEGGRRALMRLLAGAAAGLAIGFKYTAGLVLLAPALASRCRCSPRRDVPR